MAMMMMNEDANVLMEVPVLFPPIDASPQRFVINDTECSIRRAEEFAVNKANDDDETPSSFCDETLLRGSASISPLSGLEQEKTVLTTTILVDKPWILSVALSSGNIDPSATSSFFAPVMIQLDLGSETKSYSETVKVKAFAIQQDLIRLILIDKNATIITLLLDAKTLLPIHDSVQVTYVGDLLQEGMQEMVSPASLRPSMIDFLSPTKVIMSLNPFLLVIDINERSKKQLAVWSKSKCVEDMKHRRPTLTTFLAKSVGFLAGNLRDVLIDMKPVSALTVAKETTSCHVFTLHSDGVIRRWSTAPDPSNLYPWEVVDVTVKQIPSSETWSDADNSTMLRARLYDEGQVFALAIYVQTNGSSLSDTEEDDNDNDIGESDTHVVVVDGSTTIGEDGNVKVASHALEIPSSATSLVDMYFAEGRCSLVTLFESMEEEANNSKSSIYAIYPPSQIYIVSCVPVEAAPSDHFLDQVALRERKRISSLSFYPVLETDLRLEDALHEVDTRFLRYLFRPCFPRGIGAILPPAAAHIRRALHKLIPAYRGPEPGDNINIELETLLAIQDWRTRDSRKIISMTPVKRSRDRVATPGTDMAEATTASIYDSLIQLDEDECSDTEEMEDVEQSERDKEAELKVHERRWRQLLLGIWEEEKSQRVPLCLALSTNSRDTAMLVRPATTSAVVRIEKNDDGNELMGLIDNVAVKLLSAVETDEELSRELVSAEQIVWETISTAQLALDPDDNMKFEEKFNSVVQDVHWNSIVTPTENNYLLDQLQRVSEEDLRKALEDPPIDSCNLDLCLVAASDVSRSRVPNRSEVASTQMRLAASSLSVRSIDSARRLLLGRFLVLTELAARPSVGETAALAYLNSVGVMWSSAQHVPMPDTISTLGNSVLQLQLDSSSPPTKRHNHVGSLTSALACHGTLEKTTALDALLLYLSRGIKDSQSPVSLASAAFESSLRFTELPGDEVVPELAIKQPKIALRLLAPIVALQSQEESSDLSRKSEAMAECLLMNSHTESQARAKVMARRALDLYGSGGRIDAAGLDRLQRHCSTPELSNMLVGFIRDVLEKDPNDASLWSGLFTTAISARRWREAYRAGLKLLALFPQTGPRPSNFMRLVREMVDAGSLADLLDICVSLNSKQTADVHADAFREGVDLYGIAAETLAEASIRDVYLFLATEPNEILSDYQGASYALHVSQGHWRRAAQSMDLRYVNAKRCLDDGPTGAELDVVTAVFREALIVDDVVLATLGCANAIELVEDSNMKYIVSGDTGPSIQLNPSQIDRSIDRVTGDGLARYMSAIDLTTQAVRSSALRTLFSDGLVDSTWAKTAFLRLEHSSATDRAIADALFSRGYYLHGLLLGKQMSKRRGSNPMGRDLFHDILGQLLCSYLVPLAIDDKVSLPRPTSRQIQAALGIVGQSEDPPVLVSGSKKTSLLRRTGVMALLRCLTTAEPSLAIEVASTFFAVDRRGAALPTWLEQLLLKGTSDVDAPGLFARRPGAGAHTFLGDPSALLTLYTNQGMYKDACRIVTTVLSVHGREEKAPSRLPEKGDMDFVPYNKIDLLYNLTEVILGKGELDAEKAEDLSNARDAMVQCLKEHFALLKISEMGLTSARSLST